MESRDLDAPLPADDRFAVDVARLLDGRPDPSTNVAPPANPPVDLEACLAAQRALDRLLG